MKNVCAFACSATLSVLFIAAAAPNAAAAPAPHAAPTVAGDCNANGTPDLQEPLWADRDDDGDESA